jgi:hypothetical protein
MSYISFTLHQILIWGISESSRTRSKNKCWLNLHNFGCHLLQNILLGTYTLTPWFFFPCFKSIVEVTFVNAVEYCLQFPFDVRLSFKMSSLQFHFQFGKKTKSRG